jgi:hypothetical protein
MSTTIEYFGIKANLVYACIKPNNFQQKYHCALNEFYLEVDNVAKYFVQAITNTITIEINPNIEDPHIINTWLYGTVFAYLLQYHGYLVLHGSAIVHDNQAVIFSGESGAGKSTLATKFVALGHQLLTDDVVAIKTNPQNGKFEMIPGMAKVKLWSNALNHFGESSHNLQAIANKEDKFELPINSHYNTHIQIKAFFELNHTDSTNKINITPIFGIDKINFLINNTYRYHMLVQLQNGLNKHLKQTAKLAKTIEIYKVIRPNNQYLLDELANKIEAILNK